jgi:hypothetical protein
MPTTTPKTTPSTTKPTQTWHTAATFETNVFTVSDLADARDIAHECGHAVANHGARVAYAEYQKRFDLDKEARERLQAASTARAEANTKHREAVMAYIKLDEKIVQASQTKQPIDALSAGLPKADALVKSCAEQEATCVAEHEKRTKEREATKAAMELAHRDFERVKGTGMTVRVANFFAFVNKHEIGPGITEYARSTWPEKPEEFYAEAYADWIMDQAKLRKHSEKLLDWFKTGGHRNDTPPG